MHAAHLGYAGDLAWRRNWQGIGNRWAAGHYVANYYITPGTAAQVRLRKKAACSQKQKRPDKGRLSLDLTQSYFGGGVAGLLPEFFLLFLPPLWPFLPDLVFSVLVVFSPVAGLSVEVFPPLVAWAKERLAPNIKANAIVSSFFIQSPSN